MVRLSTGYDLVGGVLEVATGSFTIPSFPVKKYSGVYFLCKETEDKVLPYIQQKNKHLYIVDADIWGEIQEVQCNSDRGGYFIYQADNKLYI